MKTVRCQAASSTYLMILVSLSLLWAPTLSSDFGTLFQLRQAKPLALSTGITSTANTLATSAVAQWINQHRALTIATTVAAIGLVTAFASVIKKYRDNQPPIIPPAPPAPPMGPAHYVRHNRFIQKLPSIPEANSLTSQTVAPSSSTSSKSASTTSTTTNASVTQLAQPTQTAPATTALSSSSSSAPVSSSATTPLVTASSTLTAPISTQFATATSTPAPAPIHPVETSSRTVSSSSTSSSTNSSSQGRRSPTISGKAQHSSFLQLSPEIRARLGLTNDLNAEQLHAKLKNLCERYEAGRQLFQKICSQHQELSNSWIEIESSQNLPGEQALSNLMWFFYLYGGLQNERNIFKEGTFRIVDHVDARLTNFFEFILGTDGIQKRLASHFKQCQSYGIDIDHNKCPLPPHGKRHLLLGQPASNEIYLKPENFGVNGFSDGISHFGEFVIARMCKNNMLQRLFNLESDSAPQNRKEHLLDKIKEQLKKIKKQIHQAYVIEEIRTLVPQLNNLLRDAVDNNKLALANEIQIALKEIESEYPDWKDRVGNEVVLDVDELLQAPGIVIDGELLRIRR